ncbi:tetratricopeptide repeat protein [bacterium]|nr:tetratricopeptide repeat protein [bacterium]
MILQNKEAKSYFYQKKYQKAFELFYSQNDYYGAGLCCLMLKKQESARKFWKRDKSCPACLWGLCVLDFINLKIPLKLPTFFQTRAFLEVYLNLFIENDLIEMAQNMVASCDILYQSNPETYKFIGRALFANGYFDLAIKFCKKSLKLCYADPEAFLILSQCYFLLGNLGEALDCVNRINAMVQGYYPTILFEKILREEIEKKRNEK